MTTTVTDTGEKKQFFGVAARHLKVVTVQEPSAGACDGAKRRVEIDGWYADFEAPAANLQRTKEIGIRVALGATAGGVSRLVLKQSLRLAAIGSGVGVTLALGLSRLLASELVFMRVFDAAAFSAGVLLVALAAVAAGTCRRGERRVSIQSTRCATTDRPRSYR